jgi:hypothetical protein
MDTDEGVDTDPLSLHKYLYTEGDPVDGVDPTGNDNLAEITAGFSVSETLDVMPQLHAANLTGKLGIGIEPPDPSAIQNGALSGGLPLRVWFMQGWDALHLRFCALAVCVRLRGR